MTLPDRWWRDKDILQAEVAEHGSCAEAGRAHGIRSSTVSKAWSELGLPRRQTGIAAKLHPVGEDSQVSELEMLKQRNAELERYAKRQREGEVAEERLLDLLRESVKATAPRYAPRPPRKRGKQQPHEMALLFSDTHASEVVRHEETLGMNAYDWDVMLERLDRMREGVLSHLEHHAGNVSKLHVWLLGDMLSGDIHEELAITNDRPAAQAAVDFGYECARWLEEFVPHFERISVAGVPGNHPRASKKPSAKMAHNNGDWIAYQVTRALLRDNPAFEWNLPRAAYATTIVADRWRVLLMHGDGIRSSMPGVPWGGVVRRVTTLEQQFSKAKQPLDYVCLGHFHTANALDGVGCKTFLNGSVKGLDEYSLKQFGSGRPPSQLLLTFAPQWGVTGTQYLDLEPVEPAGRVAA